MAGAWHFERAGDTLTATEPDGALHTVQMGDWGSPAGAALLNRMVESLSEPDRISTICKPPEGQHEDH